MRCPRFKLPPRRPILWPNPLSTRPTWRLRRPCRASLPDGVRAALQRISAEVEKTCDYVGPRFAREVRAMAEPGAPYRPVYGEATPDEAAALAEDGIDVARIPWVPRADS